MGKFDYGFLNISVRRGGGPIDEDDENLARYFNDINNQKITSEDTEQEIIRKIKTGEGDVTKLKADLIYRHQAFVIMFAKRHCPKNSGLLNDLIQEGNYGMLMALENFKLDSDVKFITYANSWIMKYILLFLENNELVQRNNRSKTFGVDVKIREKFIKENGYEPTSQELMDAFNDAGISIKDKCDLDNVTVISIDAQVVHTHKGSEEDEDNLPQVQYGEEETITHKLDTKLLKDNIARVFKILTDDEAAVVRKKLGFNGGIEEDYPAIATELGITPFKARSLFESAKIKIKKNRRMFE